MSIKPTTEISELGHPLLYFLAALVCIGLESIPVFDITTQQLFFQNGEWLISETFHNSHKLLLYTGPKILIICTGIGFIALMVASFISVLKERLRQWRGPALLVLICLIFVPSSVAICKTLTGVYSPTDLFPYGGKYEHVGFVAQLYTYGMTAGGRSFPAGHASGGFALMALFYLPVQTRIKRSFLLIGLFAGWSMGIYQMARGEHFLSHTLTTMFMALAIITLLSKITCPTPKYTT